MSLAAISAGLSIISSISGLIGGNLDKKAQLRDVIAQSNLGISNLDGSMSLTRGNLTNNTIDMRQLTGLRENAFTDLKRTYDEQKGKNTAMVGASAVSLKGSPADLYRKNKTLYQEDRSSLGMNFSNQLRSLRSERDAYNNDLQGMQRQKNYLTRARSVAYEAYEDAGGVGFDPSNLGNNWGY